MSEVSGLRLTPSARQKESRLTALLRDCGAGGAEHIARAIEDAQVAGSLELAGTSSPADETRLRRALHLPVPEAFSAAALLGWHEAATGEGRRFRLEPRARPTGPPT